MTSDGAGAGTNTIGRLRRLTLDGSGPPTAFNARIVPSSSLTIDAGAREQRMEASGAMSLLFSTRPALSMILNPAPVVKGVPDRVPWPSATSAASRSETGARPDTSMGG